MITDFLMEEKGRILKLEKELKGVKSESRKGLIKAQIAVYFQEGLEALARFEQDTPKSVRDWFLGYRKNKPGFDEISSEMVGKRTADRRLDSKLVYIALAIAIGVLSVLYFFSIY